MTIDEIKKSLELLKAEIEWDKSIEYQITIENVFTMLEELKIIKEINLEIPQHFTKEQSNWIKSYCIKRNKEFYEQALEDITDGIFKILPDNIETRISSGAFAIELLNIVENLKGENDGNIFNNNNNNISSNTDN